MSRFRIVDLWDDSDPALKRMQEALALTAPTEAAPAEPDPVAIPVPSGGLDPAERQSKAAELLARLRAGDLSAADLLRRILDGR